MPSPFPPTALEAAPTAKGQSCNDTALSVSPSQGPSGHAGGGPPLQVVPPLRQDISSLPRRGEQAGSEPKDGGVGRAYVRSWALSCSAASHLLLGVLGEELSKMSVWRDAQEAAKL